MSEPVSPRARDALDQQDRSLPYPATSSNNLEHRLLHKVLVGLNAPAKWPGWLIGCVALLPLAGVAGLWWWLVGDRQALFLAAALAVFLVTDGLILVALRHWRVSFGPLGPQLFAFELPRLAVALIAILPAVWLGSALAFIGVLVINLGASLALLWGALLEPQWLGLSNVSFVGNVALEDVPPVRLLHISDLHVERFGRREEQLLRTVRAVAPDLIVLTGDYVNLSYVDDPVARDDTRRILEALSSNGASPAPYGVYAVLGSPPVDRNSVSLFEGLPIRLLRDEVVTIDLPVPSSPPRLASGQSRRLVLVGLDCSHDPERDAEQLASVLAPGPPDACRVLLYHSPELMPVAPNFDINLYLCGHTHGGQVRLPFFGALVTASRLGKRFEMGYYRLKDTHLYVSRGVGFEGMGAPRVRFLCPPEMTLISIHQAEDGHQGCDKTPDVW